MGCGPSSNNVDEVEEIGGKNKVVGVTNDDKKKNEKHPQVFSEESEELNALTIQQKENPKVNKINDDVKTKRRKEKNKIDVVQKSVSSENKVRSDSSGVPIVHKPGRREAPTPTPLDIIEKKLKDLKKDIGLVRSNEDVNLLRSLAEKLFEDLEELQTTDNKVKERQLRLQQHLQDIRKQIQEFISTPKYNKEVISEQRISRTLTNIREYANRVKNVLNNATAPTAEELNELNDKLIKALWALHQIKDNQADEEIKILRQEIHWFFVSIQLKTTQITNSVDNEDPNQLDQQQIEAQTIESVKAKIEEIDPEIQTFVGLENSKKFFELDETLIRSTLKLDDIRPEKGSELHNNKISLLKKIHRYTDILDDRVRQTEEIEEFERKVKEISVKIDSFDGSVGEEKKISVKEELIKLKNNLGELVTNEQLQKIKKDCIKEVDKCLEKIALVQPPTLLRSLRPSD